MTPPVMVAQIFGKQKLADKSVLKSMVTIAPKQTIVIALNGLMLSGFRKKSA